MNENFNNNESTEFENDVLTTHVENDKDVKKSIYVLLEEEIMSMDISDAEKAKYLSRLLRIRNQKLNIMFVGSTGAGKSSTVNALFNMEIAKIGTGTDPETEIVGKYELDNLIIWDTPGLGDGVDADEKIKRMLLEKLNEMDEEGNPLIDLVVVVMDSSSKDLGTSYNLINNILVPALGEEAEKRILIGLNQADIAMKGTHWDIEKNEPDEVLKDFLKKKATSVKNRIYEATGLKLTPICYCAGYKEDGGEQRKPYNLTKLFYYIVKAVPKDKRLAFIDNINADDENWTHDDGKDYVKKVEKSFGEALWAGIEEGVDFGIECGKDLIGIPGIVVGAVLGAIIGTGKGLFSAIFQRK